MSKHERSHTDVDALAVLDESTEVTMLSADAVGVMVKSEVEAQLDAAHKYPRSVRSFLNEAITLATLDKEVAMSCLYAVPRAGKVISGPSVRLAEICASAYGNLHMGARIIGADDKVVTAQGVCLDLEKNNRITIEVQRRITSSRGDRFNDDMIGVTGNAAASIGLRNAIFRVIPKAYVNAVYAKAREVSVGNAHTLRDTREKVFERLVKTGVTRERALYRVSRASIEDVTLDDVEILIGLGTALKNDNGSIDELFPEPPAAKAADAPRGTSAIDKIVGDRAKEKQLGNAQPAPTAMSTPAPMDKPSTAKPAEATASQQDWERIEIECTDAGITLKRAKQYVESLSGMNFSSWNALPIHRIPELIAWIKAQTKPERR